MDFSQVLDRRMSVRAFTEEAVSNDIIVALLEKSARAPSGGNLQPWRVAVLNGARMAAFKGLMEKRLNGEKIEGGEVPEYPVYPLKMGEPYRTRRFAVGEQMYALLGIERENRPARLAWFANNFRFFGAPAAIFCFVDRQMGAAQWSDLGMFLQSFMLAAVDAGLDTCPQECWSQYPRTVGEFCGAQAHEMLFCGVAIGHRDTNHPVNALRSERAPLEEWVTIV